jgi:lincosamide nucleotidyltransferase A/C/D/E
MTLEAAVRVLTALGDGGVRFAVGGGWAIDALVGRETRVHGDLDLWVPADDFAPLLPVLVALGIDRLLPWGGDRPWVVVVHNGGELRVDCHFYEALPDGALYYGSVLAGYRLPAADLDGRGTIGDLSVRCETPACALRHKTGHTARDVDRTDIALLCSEFGLELPHDRLP